MEASEQPADARAKPAIRLPVGLTVPSEAFPTVFVDAEAAGVGTNAGNGAFNAAIGEALERVHPGTVAGPVLLKVHIGEPKCVTRMRPECVADSVEFLWRRRVSSVVAGDTTVAYTGERGHRQNPVGDASVYMELARKHGWSEDGPAGMPFVVLDRPSTSRKGQLEFTEEERAIEALGVRRYREIQVAGGFAAAGFVINHAHLTLHGLAGVAGCVKSIAMGLTTLRGKLRMHQSLLPCVDPQRCVACQRCVESCPERALRMDEDAGVPVLDRRRCIGCGECEALCKRRSITLRGEDIADWERGRDTLPFRMVDYAMGIMDGRWENTIHMLHMESITERCDCLNERQTPILGRNIGVLLGKNPFAVDRLAALILTQALRQAGREPDDSLLDSAESSALYASNAYGVLNETPLEVMPG